MTNRRSGILVALLALGALYAASIVGRELAAGYYAGRGGSDPLESLERAAELSPRNWLREVELGNFNKLTGQYAAALDNYLRATELFEACGLCWINVAEVRAIMGQDPDEALGKAIDYGRSVTAVRTRAAVLYARTDREELAAREWSAAVAGWGRRSDAEIDEFYGLLHRLYSPDFIREKIISDGDLPRYFRYAFSVLRPVEMDGLWNRYRSVGASEEDRQYYAFYLMVHGLVHEAWKTEFSQVPPLGGTVVAGDFENITDGGMFGWKLSDAEGVKARVLRCEDCSGKGRALNLKFDGEHNVDYAGVSQVVPVEPGGTYRLEAKAKSEQITSARGPSLRILGLGGQIGDAAEACGRWSGVWGPEFRLSQNWHPVSLVFRVPDQCEGVYIKLVRPATDRLNKFLGGELWLDDIRLERLSAAS